jgi:hypothetical protein
MRICNKRLLVFSVAALLSIGASTAAAQAKTGQASILNVRISQFQVTDGTMLDALATLSASPVPLALGFESILKTKSHDPAPADVRFSLNVRNKTVRQVLDALCAIDQRYTWSQDKETINVYPRATMGDASYFLNYKLDRVEISKAPNPDQALWSIVDRLPGPKQPTGYVQMGGDQSYPNPWTVCLQNLTVRQALNRVSAHMGPRTSWIFFGAQDYQAFTFHKGSFNSAMKGSL